MSYRCSGCSIFADGSRVYAKSRICKLGVGGCKHVRDDKIIINGFELEMYSLTRLYSFSLFFPPFFVGGLKAFMTRMASLVQQTPFDVYLKEGDFGHIF